METRNSWVHLSRAQRLLQTEFTPPVGGRALLAELPCSRHISLPGPHLPCESSQDLWERLRLLSGVKGKLLALNRSGSRLMETMLLVTHLFLWEEPEQRKKGGGREVENQSQQMLRAQWQDADRTLCRDEHWTSSCQERCLRLRSGGRSRPSSHGSELQTGIFLRKA